MIEPGRLHPTTSVAVAEAAGAGMNELILSTIGRLEGRVALSFLGGDFFITVGFDDIVKKFK